MNTFDSYTIGSKVRLKKAFKYPVLGRVLGIAEAEGYRQTTGNEPHFEDWERCYPGWLDKHVVFVFIYELKRCVVIPEDDLEPLDVL